jgi:hypothetical protein
LLLSRPTILETTVGYRITPLLGLCGSVLLGVTSSPIGAQQEPSIGRGALVRVSHTDPCCTSPRVGTLVLVSADSIVIQERGASGMLVALRRESVTTVERGYDIGSRMARGAGLGLLIGAGIGVTYVLVHPCDDDALCGSVKPYLAVIAGGGGGVVGLLVGGALGSSVRRVVWRGVPPTELGFGLGHGGGPGIRLTLRF